MVFEPPCTERYARWCERTTAQIMSTLLLDFNMLLEGLLQEGVEGRPVHAADCACNYAAIGADDI